jgi:hypothetical protein
VILSKIETIKFWFFQGKRKIHKTQLCCLLDSQEEVTEYFDDLLQDLEFRGFVCKSQTADSVTFVKNPPSSIHSINTHSLH